MDARDSPRRSSSVPPNPFWSRKTQDDHELDQLRPRDLDGRDEPVPHDDDDLDSSPKPLMSSDVAGDGRELGTFQTPPDGKRNPEEGERRNHDHDLEATTNDPKPVTNGATEKLATDGATGKRMEGIWKRRNQQGQHEGMPMGESHEKLSENYGVERELERALGEEMLQHFQGEAARLQTQNEVLLREIQKLKEEKHHALLSMPSSWNESRRAPTPPPRRTPPTQESQHVWMSPESVLHTPNGTRVPEGPPPPDPPPLPAWPVDLRAYEACPEPPRKVRGLMGDVPFRPSGETVTPQPARTIWLEREVASLQELLDREALKNRSM
jgi:hypothetical protein